MFDPPHLPAPSSPSTAWPVLLPHAGRVVHFDSTTGGLDSLTPATLPRFTTPVLTCYAPPLYAALGQKSDALPVCADILELYAFVCPAIPCPPTVLGLAHVLGHMPSNAQDDWGIEDAAMLLPVLTATLLDRAGQSPDAPIMRALLPLMQDWAWSDKLRGVLGDAAPDNPIVTQLLNRLQTWKVAPPRPETPQISISAEEAATQLDLLRDTLHGSRQEVRADQKRYAQAVATIFDPAVQSGAPNVVLAEAGTGVGKTLGYLAPSMAWSSQSGGQVWISTYTRALQRQITQDLQRLQPQVSPDPNTSFFAVRKGRENYLCLLNFEDATRRIATSRAPRDSVLAGLVARWISLTTDGDMTGTDFPAWLSGLFGYGAVQSFADKRGECIYAGCPHFSRCFGERAIRKADTAQIVVSNHALTLLQAGGATLSSTPLPPHMILDEGHQLFPASDSLFTLALSGQSGQDLRRWLLGPEDGSRSARSRLRGLKRRIEDICATDPESEKALHAIIQHARILPSHGWSNRLQTGEPLGPFETFLGCVQDAIMTQIDPKMTHYGHEVLAYPVPAPVADSLPALHAALTHLQSALAWLAQRCQDRLDDDTDGDMDTQMRDRLASTAHSIRIRIKNGVGGWIAMAQSLRDNTQDARQLMWYAIQRDENAMQDIGAYCGWIDPTLPMAALLAPQAQGIAITSATLRDKAVDSDPALAWHGAKSQTGVMHMAADPSLVTLPSPFDYAAQTRVFVLNDVAYDDINALARAYESLFLAAGGGALGLFTAISRLREVHKRIQAPLHGAGVNLYAQHIDPMDTGTLVDIFRHDTHACLLGTDALRDGVDVPGDALRLLVFDKIPWPRPTLLHQARRAHFGGRAYDDRLTRYRLKQAYGRLIRRAGDHGVFVLCDGPLPSKLQDAFPPGVSIERVGLAEAVAAIKPFLQGPETPVLPE
ncbi:MAG: ATP-dependent DNA helicase [Pseudomonadota bacterium]